MSRVYNFSAGPAVLPEEVLKEAAEEMLDRLMTQLAEQEGLTETMKAEKQMEWVQRMNSIRSRAEEVVQNNLICI